MISSGLYMQDNEFVEILLGNDLWFVCGTKLHADNDKKE